MYSTRRSEAMASRQQHMQQRPAIISDEYIGSAIEHNHRAGCNQPAPSRIIYRD